LHDRKRVEVKEFEKKLAKAEAKVEMAQKLYTTRLADELKMAKEEVEPQADNQQRKMNEELLSIEDE